MADNADHKLLETLIVRELEKRGGGGDNGGMEPRIAKMEARLDGVDKRLDGVDRRLDRIDIDLRMLLGAMAAGFVAMAALMAKGFHWIG